jgi:hypothetical protein
MSDQQDSYGTGRLSKKPQDIAVPWSMDQELREKTPFPSSKIKGEKYVERDTRRLDDSTTTTTTTNPSPSPPYSPPVPSPLMAIDADQEIVQQISEWMLGNRISGINYLLRHYTVKQLDRAADDFEQALDQGIKLRNPGGFFVSLLK